MGGTRPGLQVDSRCAWSRCHLSKPTCEVCPTQGAGRKPWRSECRWSGRCPDRARTMGAGRYMRAVGPQHARQAEVGQLAHVAARVLRRRRAALDEHVGALQVTAGQQPCAITPRGQSNTTQSCSSLQTVRLTALLPALQHCVHCWLMHVISERSRLRPHACVRDMQLYHARSCGWQRGGHLCTMPKECRYFMPEAMSDRLSSVLPCTTGASRHHQSLHSHL